MSYCSVKRRMFSVVGYISSSVASETDRRSVQLVMPLTSPTTALRSSMRGGGQFPPKATRHILFRPRDAQVDGKLFEGFIRLLPRLSFMFATPKKRILRCLGYAVAKSYLVSLNEAIFVLTLLHQNVNQSSSKTFYSLRLTLCNTSFNIQKFCVPRTMHLCVLGGSQNKQRLVPLTA